MKPFPIAIVMVAAASRLAVADLRSMTQTYEYGTLPSGVTEVELWHTESRDSWDSTTPQRFEQIVELEHGITDRFCVGMYTVFTQVSASDPAVAQPFVFDNVRAIAKYRFADRAVWPVDLELYFELYRYFGRSQYELESKVIVQRDFDDLRLAANLIGELEVGNDVVETEAEFSWTAGAVYQVHPKVRLGAETWGGEVNEALAVSAGPAVGVTLSPRTWIAFTAGFGITEAADAFNGRAIIGLGL